jgi:uncharacterized protein YndB with AHSA1/START domain
MKADEKPIVVEETFNATIDAVWRSITQLDLMKQWYFDNIPEFKPEVGFETQFNVKSQDRDFLHMWRVTEVVPMKKIAYDWKYDSYPGDAFVVFELTGQDYSTKLTLTCNVREDFPDDIPEFSRESCLAGWKYFISQNLKEFLKRTS